MSSGSIPDFSSDYIPDVSYTGALDTNYLGDFSGPSTLQDTIVGSPTLSLDTSYGLTDGSVYDLMDTNDPVLSQSLSGTSDPPIGSAAYSQPNPNPSPITQSLSTGLSALAKFGSGFAALMGGSSGRTVQVNPNNPQLAVPRPGAGTPPSGSTVIILVIVAGALMLLISRGGN